MGGKVDKRSSSSWVMKDVDLSYPKYRTKKNADWQLASQPKCRRLALVKLELCLITSHKSMSDQRFLPVSARSNIPSFIVMDVLRDAADKDRKLIEAGSDMRVVHLEVTKIVD